MHVRVGPCGSQQILNLLGLPVGCDGDEYIAPVYRFHLVAGCGFRILMLISAPTRPPVTAPSPLAATMEAPVAPDNEMSDPPGRRGARPGMARKPAAVSKPASPPMVPPPTTPLVASSAAGEGLSSPVAREGGFRLMQRQPDLLVGNTMQAKRFKNQSGGSHARQDADMGGDPLIIGLLLSSGTGRYDFIQRGRVPI